MRTRGHRDDPCYGRRAVLGLGLATLAVGPARPEDAAAKAPPQPNDRFVSLAGPKKGEVVRVDSIAVGGPQLQVYPVSPDGTVRNETPLNLVILVRFDPAELSEETRARAAESVVAYSAVCTHQACPMNMWSKDRNAFVCSMPRFGLRPQERRRSDWRTGTAPLAFPRPKGCRRRRHGRRSFFESRRRSRC